jgi:hypothetical protein
MLVPTFARGQSDPALWRFVDPNSRAVIGIDWARIRQSPAGAMIREKWIPHDMLPGFPLRALLDSIDRVLILGPVISSSADSQDDSAGDSTKSGNAEILIVIHGHFDAAQVRQLFSTSGAKAQSYNAFRVYRPQRNKDAAYVLFDAETILYGDPPTIFATLDRNQFAAAASQSSPAPGSMAARAAALDAKYEVWTIMDTSELASNETVAALLGGNEWATGAQGIEAGLNLRAGVDADIILRFSSEDTAKRVTTDWARAVNLVAKDKSVDSLARDISKKLKFNVDGSAGKISLHLNEQELDRTAQAFAASEKAGERMAENAATIANPAPAPAPPAAPAKPSVIRIEGLDEGTREIPYPDPER